MHPASSFLETDCDVLRGVAEARGFATLIAVQDGRPVTAAAPALFEGDRLRFHLANRNRLTAALLQSRYGLAVFSAGDAYISPDWYAASDQVPTWNYRSVEIEGAVTPLSDTATTQLLDDLSVMFENRLAPKPPWTRAKMSLGAFDKLLAAITGFEMKIERMEGTFKLSQNKPASERARVAARLAECADSGSQAMSSLMSA